MKSNIKKALSLLLASVLIAALGAGCGQEERLSYRIDIEGEGLNSGVLTFLDYSINVYKDLASDPCGDCADQPVHLFAGASAEDAAQAIAEQIERADDLWEVSSVEGGTVVLQEKTPGSIDVIPAISAPAGLTFSAAASGRNVTMLSAEVSAEKAEETVEWPDDPQRLAAVYGPSYELLTMLGAEDKIVVRADVQTSDFPWAEKVFRRITEVPQLVNVHTSVNFEELMQYKPDIVYSFPRQNEVNQLERAQVAVLPGQTEKTLDDLKTQVREYAATLGDEAEERAELYCAFFDTKLAELKEVVKDIPEDERKTVYYAGTDILTTYGKYSDVIEVIEAAGGIAVSKNLEAGSRSQIDYEQLMQWNPDLIFIDHGGMNDGKTAEEIREELMSKSTYSALKAVKNEQVYLSPSGVFYWDMGIQKILLAEYMAKILYPELFEDLDMAEEVQTFYKTFFDYELSTEDAQRILNRQDPA